MAYPLKSVTVTCPYRYVSSRKPSPWVAGYHPGVDFKALTPTPTYAPAGGKIIFAGWTASYGWLVIGQSKGTDGKMYRWYVAHHSKLSVKTGATVKLGARIGTSGATGNTFGPHVHFEVRKAGYGYWDHVNPAVILNVKATTKTPAPAPITPWFDGLAQNLAASDSVKGKATWDTRMPLLLPTISHYDRDVLTFVEAESAGKQGSAFEKGLDSIGYQLVVADNQRMIATREGTRVGRTKVVTLSEQGPAKDDKQIVMAEIFPRGSTNAAIVECGHFEFREGAAYDAVRLDQGKETRAVTLDFAKACGVPETRVVFYNDENSNTLVSDKAFGGVFGDLGDRPGYENEKYSTLIGWNGKPVIGIYRPDKVHLHDKRPGKGGTSTTFAGKKLADHLPVIYTVGKI